MTARAVFFVLLFSWSVVLAAAIINELTYARSMFGPFGPVGWRFHWRRRWWLTPGMRRLLVQAAALAAVALHVGLVS